MWKCGNVENVLITNVLIKIDPTGVMFTELRSDLSPPHSTHFLNSSILHILHIFTLFTLIFAQQSSAQAIVIAQVIP